MTNEDLIIYKNKIKEYFGIVDTLGFDNELEKLILEIYNEGVNDGVNTMKYIEKENEKK